MDEICTRIGKFWSSKFFFETNLDASLEGALKEMSVLKFVIANGLA